MHWFFYSWDLDITFLRGRIHKTRGTLQGSGNSKFCKKTPFLFPWLLFPPCHGNLWTTLQMSGCRVHFKTLCQPQLTTAGRYSSDLKWPNGSLGMNNSYNKWIRTDIWKGIKRIHQGLGTHGWQAHCLLQPCLFCQTDVWTHWPPPTYQDRSQPQSPRQGRGLHQHHRISFHLSYLINFLKMILLKVISNIYFM